MSSYKTVKQSASGEFVEKKSRFIGCCAPVTGQSEALDFINAVRARHRDASHNVYAYILRENNIMRYSDDGEPSGTAGSPVLDVLRREGITNAAVVVTRYFGGILLGAGGLVRAYTKGAKTALDAAERIEKVFCGIYSVKCDYSSLGKLQYAVTEGGFNITGTNYTDLVEFIVSVKDEDCAAFESLITDKSSGASVPELLRKEYVDFKITAPSP